jgi:hypothetical protein
MDTHLWATPNTSDSRGTRQEDGKRNTGLNTHAMSWSTPRAEDGERGDRSEFAGLMEDVKSWATPTAQDERNGMLPPSQLTRDTFPGNVAAWASPDAQAFNASQTREEHRPAMEKMKAKKYNGNGAGETLGIMANSFDRGTTPSRCEEPTEPSGSSPARRLKRGLNHRFGLWLMGYPAEWLDCDPSGTRGSRKPPSQRSA